MVFELRKVKKSQRVIEVKRLLEKVELLGTELLYPEDLSGGMKQRVALAQVLGNDPEIMFLDEPFSALDLQSRYNMQKLLLRLQNEIGFSVFIITHDITEAINISDRILILSGGLGGQLKIIENTIPKLKRFEESKHSSSLYKQVSMELYNSMSSSNSL